LKRLISNLGVLVSLAALIGLIVPWISSHQQMSAVTLFRWRYHGGIANSTSWQATFAISGGEFGIQAVRFYGSFPVHSKYHQRWGDGFHEWIHAAGRPTPLTRSNDWPAHYGLRHGGDPTPDFMQSWRLVLPMWGMAIVFAIAPGVWAWRRARKRWKPAIAVSPITVPAEAAGGSIKSLDRAK
jgi:hypothetical protein